MVVTLRICLLAAVLAVSGVCPALAGCENDLMFGVSLDDPQQAFIAEPLNFSTTFRMNSVMGVYVIDRGVNFYRTPEGTYELSSVRVQQVSCSPGLTGGTFFGGSNPGYMDLSASNPHRHINWGASAPGTYLFEFKLTDAKDINGASLKDSPVFLMVFVAGSDYASVDIKTAHRMPDGAKVAISGLVASCGSEFWGFQYAQAQDRSAGLRMQTWNPVPAGTRFSARGVLGTAGGERVLIVDEVTSQTPGSAPRPLMMKTSSLGGYGEVINTPSSVGASGLRTTGLLVKVCGRISYDSYGEAYVDEGAGSAVNPAVPGVRISTEDLAVPLNLPPDGFVEVTGISGVDENLLPVIRPRSGADVRPL